MSKCTLSFEETHDLINLIKVKNEEELHSTINTVEKLDRPKLGYTVDLVVCSHCGYIHSSIHPIPIMFPCECSKCGRMSCYICEEEG